MQRTCFTLEVVPGQEEEYDRRHHEVWPELVAELRAAGVRNYTVFRRGRTVIGYAECEPDAATSFGRVARTNANRRWNEWFASVLVSLPGGDGSLADVATAELAGQRSAHRDGLHPA